jgi:hypothetical protein
MIAVNALTMAKRPNSRGVRRRDSTAVETRKKNRLP